MEPLLSFQKGPCNTIRPIVSWAVYPAAHRIRLHQCIGIRPEHCLQCHLICLQIEPNRDSIFPQDNWHPVMDLAHQGICFRGDDGTGVYRFAIFALPVIPKTGQGKVAPISGADKMGLFVSFNLLPLVKSARWNDTPPMLDWPPEGWFFFDPVGPCIDQRKLGFSFLRPKRYQTPVEHDIFGLASFDICTDREDILRGGDVVIFKEGRFRQMNGFIAERAITEEGKASTHCSF